MTNSDTTFGTYNKVTREYKIHWVHTDEVVSQTFGGNVETAKSFFFTDNALACWNDNSTRIAWAITSDGNGLKVTNDFGTKGASDQDATQDWAALWTARKNTLQAGDDWIKASAIEAVTQSDGSTVYSKCWKMAVSSDHLTLG